MPDERKDAREDSAQIPVATSDAEPAVSAAQKQATAAPKVDPPTDGTPQSSEPAGADGAAPAQDDGKPAAPRKNDAQKRIDRLTRNWREADRRAAEERGRREQLEQENARLRAQGTPPSPPAASSADDEPQPEDFNDLKEWSRAYAKWELGKTETPAAGKPAANGKADQPSQPQNVPNANDEINIKITPQQIEALERARTAHDDFDEVIADGMAQLPASALVAAHDYDDAPELLYALVEAGELERFRGMSDRQVQREVWKFAESRSTNPGASETPQATAPGDGTAPPQARPTERAVSRAGPIPTKVSGAAPSNRSSADLAANDIGSFIKKRDAEDKQAGYR